MRLSHCIWAILATCLYGELLGCSDPSSAVDGEPVGIVGLALQVAPGVVLDGTTYTIKGPKGYQRSGTVDLSASPTLSVLIGGIPAGLGYTITIAASATNGTTNCGGAASFDVIRGGTTAVSVFLACHEQPRSGAVEVNGVLNICPVIDGISADPSQVFVGSRIELSASAHDSDHGPLKLAYHWDASQGTLNDASLVNPSYLCVKPGQARIRLAVFDGDPGNACGEISQAIQVTCIDPVPVGLDGPPGCAPYGGRADSTAQCCNAITALTGLSGRVQGERGPWCEGLPITSDDLQGISETSAAFVPSFASPGAVTNPARLIVGFNPFGWATSTDGVTFTRGTSSPPFAVGNPIPGTPALTQQTFDGDPALVAPYNGAGVGKGLVVYANLARSSVAIMNSRNSDMIVATVSTDGGGSFTRTAQVNDRVGVVTSFAGTLPTGLFNWTFGGIGDQPDVTFDPADQSVWVTWRAEVGFAGSSGLMSGWIRGLKGRILASDGSFDWMDDGHAFQTTELLGQEVAGQRAQVFSRSGHPQTLAVVYANHSFLDGCPVSNGANNLGGEGFALNVSTNGGTDWTRHVVRNVVYPSCIGATLAIQNNWRPSLLVERHVVDGVLQPTNYLLTITVADVNAQGFGIGSHIEVLRHGLDFPQDGSGESWTTSYVPKAAPGALWQFDAELTQALDGEIGLAFYETDPATNTSVGARVAAADVTSDTLLAGWEDPVQLSTPTPDVMRNLGDYLGVGALPPALIDDSPLAPFPAPIYAAYGDGAGRVFMQGYGKTF